MNDDDLTRFGIRPEDDRHHPFDPSAEWWNESWFWDWFDEDGRVAGHCRVGLHPVQKRAWVWLFLYRDGEWIAIEEPRLPLSRVDLEPLSYEGWGLRFSWNVTAPLRHGRLEVEGFGRVVAGPRAGLVLPAGAALELAGTGPVHSLGRANVPGHSSETYDASRFEQPIAASGTLRFGDETIPFVGRGERDHSWGPRLWNLEWTFLAVSAADVRLQCAEVVVGGGRIGVGYLHADSMSSLSEVTFDLELHHDRLLHPLAGRFDVVAEDGRRLAGAIEPISAAEIDITHTFVPPERSIYRRALIRVHRDGGPPLLGWIEFNRFIRTTA